MQNFKSLALKRQIWHQFEVEPVQYKKVCMEKVAGWQSLPSSKFSHTNLLIQAQLQEQCITPSLNDLAALVDTHSTAPFQVLFSGSDPETHNNNWWGSTVLAKLEELEETLHGWRSQHMGLESSQPVEIPYGSESRTYKLLCTLNANIHAASVLPAAKEPWRPWHLNHILRHHFISTLASNRLCFWMR